jgi:hypothetical protein
MRRHAAAWERAGEIAAAAEGWRGAGAIDEPTARRIRETFPDPCVTPSLVWRALTAAVVSAIVLCLVGALAITFRPSDGGMRVVLIVFGVAGIVATEMLESSAAMARRGIAGATAFWGLALALAAVALTLADSLRLDDALDWFLGAAVVAWGLGCWRWGHPLFGGLSAVALFGLLARLPQPRALWLVAGVALAALAARRVDHAAWAPSHRRSAAVALVAGVAAVYAAVNVYSLDRHLIESFSRSGASGDAPRAALIILAAVATALVPLAVLVWGVLARRTLLLDAGIVLAALSVVTLRYYVHVAPLWVVLVAGGAALAVVAALIERALGRAVGGEVRGFTAAPLFSDAQRELALQVVPVVATLSPAGRAPADQEKGFAGGGTFGGAGASEKF